MRLGTWEDTPDLTYDRRPLSDLPGLAFAEVWRPVLLPRAVWIGKTYLATALGHVGHLLAVQRVLRPDKLLTRLYVARLDNFLEAEMRRSPAWTCSSSMTSGSRGWTPPRPTTSTNLWSSATAAIDAREFTPGAGHEGLAMDSNALLTQSAIDRLN